MLVGCRAALDWIVWVCVIEKQFWLQTSDFVRPNLSHSATCSMKTFGLGVPSGTDALVLKMDWLFGYFFTSHKL